MTNSRATAGKTFQVVVKKADETVNNSVTLQNDDELKVTLTISKTYGFLALIHYNSGTTPDLKIQWTVPSGATGDSNNGAPTSDGVGIITHGSSSGTTGTGANAVLFCSGRVIMSTNAGDLTFQWAQETQTVADTKVLQGSTLIVWEEQ